MFKKILALGAALALVFAASAHAVDMKNPYKVVTEVATSTFDKLKENKDKLSDIEFRKTLIREELLPYIDYKYAAYKVIGNQLKQTAPEDREAFADAFAEYIVASFADALGKYSDQELVVPEYKSVGTDEKLVNVKFLIREKGKQDLVVVFSMRKNNKTGEWRAFDMVAENISMLTAKQSELAPLIRDKGLKEVTAMLEKNNASAGTVPLK